MPRPPQSWTSAELSADAELARQIFVERRQMEQLEKREMIAESESLFRADLLVLLEESNDLRALKENPAVLEKRAVLDMARYIALPFISLGDLDTMTVSCFNTWVGQTTDKPANQRPSEEEFAAAAEYLQRETDPFRAPWLDEDRPPTDEEREQFIRATIALRFNSMLQTKRRNAGSKRQEAAIREAMALADYELTKTAQNIIDPVAEMPPRTFTKSAASLRNTSIDVPVRLADDHPTGFRFVALEAKDTNTEINSRKRLMEIADKATTWNASGLPYQIRTAAVLSGSLGLNRLKQAQDKGVMIFWEHRLDDLVAYLRG